jgi:hypothetical protein
MSITLKKNRALNRILRGKFRTPAAPPVPEPQAAPAYSLCAEIPKSYNDTYVRAIPKDPQSTFIHWEMPKEKAAAENMPGIGAAHTGNDEAARIRQKVGDGRRVDNWQWATYRHEYHNHHQGDGGHNWQWNDHHDNNNNRWDDHQHNQWHDHHNGNNHGRDGDQHNQWHDNHRNNNNGWDNHRQNQWDGNHRNDNNGWNDYRQSQWDGHHRNDNNGWDDHRQNQRDGRHPASIGAETELCGRPAGLLTLAGRHEPLQLNNCQCELYPSALPHLSSGILYAENPKIAPNLSSSSLYDINTGKR